MLMIHRLSQSVYKKGQIIHTCYGSHLVVVRSLDILFIESIFLSKTARLNGANILHDAFRKETEENIITPGYQ